jgi:hypothetical protein
MPHDVVANKSYWWLKVDVSCPIYVMQSSNEGKKDPEHMTIIPRTAP